MGVSIRETEMRDLEAIAALDRASFDAGWTVSMYEDELKKGYAVYYTAEEDGRLIGYAGIWCVYETADVSRIAVSSAARRRGIGAALMERIIDAAKRRGCERVMLEVNENNTAARSMYKKFGFKEIDIRKNYYRSGGAVIMELTCVGEGAEC